MILMGLMTSSCKKDMKNNYYFSNEIEIIKSTPERLPGFLLIDSLIGVSNVESVDSFIVLVSPHREKLFQVFDFVGNNKGNFGVKGQGPNDLLNCTPNGQKQVMNNCAFLWINDVSATKLKKINLSKSIKEQHLIIEDMIDTYPMSVNSFIIDDSLAICESMTQNNYSLIKYNYKNHNKLVENNIYLSPQKNPFNFYKSIWRINYESNILVGAMHSINQLNFWNLNTNEKKSVIIETPYLPNQIVDEKTGLENRTSFCDLEISRDFIFALYMDQEYGLSYETPKKMTLFIFNWDALLVARLIVEEYILNIAVDSKQEKLYGLCEDDKVFVYDLNGVINKSDG